MKFKIRNIFYSQFLKSINFKILKKIFFVSSLLYFCSYFFSNLSQISFKLNLDKSGTALLWSFLFCISSIYLNAFAWKNIVFWFGQIESKNKLIPFYVLTNVLKYVPGGIWHFFERFNFLKNISNYQLAFYSTLIEPYFMLCASFLLASLGIIFSPIYLFLVFPLFFLNRRLIYFVLKGLEALKAKVSFQLIDKERNCQLEEKINLTSFFPLKAFIFEIGFVLSKFIGFLICFNAVNSSGKTDITFLFVGFCLSWSIGLIVPTAPGGVGVFEACLLFFVGKNIPQNIIFVSLIYFRIISTAADLLLSFPFIMRKFLKGF